MNKFNQLLLTIVLIILIVAIPYLLYILTLNHDAKMCDYVRECHLAYKTTMGFEGCARPFMQRMIFSPSKK